MVLADSNRIPLTPLYSGYFQRPIVFAYATITLYGVAFQKASANESVYLLSYSKSDWKSRNTCDARIRVFNTSQSLGCFLFARRYWGNDDCFLFLQVLRYFSSLGSLFCTYEFSAEWRDITLAGLPHSEIRGSKVASTYPRLIAGNYVLRRLSVPRHPPCALSNLTKNLYRYR